MRIHLAIALLVLSSALAAAQAPATPPTPAAPTGDAKHGKELFESNLRCYACHGYDGQTGSPRLVPMGRPEDAFVAYVRKPSGRGMPSFAATPQSVNRGRVRLHPVDCARGALRGQPAAAQGDCRAARESQLTRPEALARSQMLGMTRLAVGIVLTGWAAAESPTRYLGTYPFRPGFPGIRPSAVARPLQLYERPGVDQPRVAVGCPCWRSLPIRRSDGAPGVPRGAGRGVSCRGRPGDTARAGVGARGDLAGGHAGVRGSMDQHAAATGHAGALCDHPVVSGRDGTAGALRAMGEPARRFDHGARRPRRPRRPAADEALSSPGRGLRSRDASQPVRRQVVDRDRGRHPSRLGGRHRMGADLVALDRRRAVISVGRPGSCRGRIVVRRGCGPASVDLLEGLRPARCRQIPSAARSHVNHGIVAELMPHWRAAGPLHRASINRGVVLAGIGQSASRVGPPSRGLRRAERASRRRPDYAPRKPTRSPLSGIGTFGDAR